MRVPTPRSTPDNGATKRLRIAPITGIPFTFDSSGAILLAFPPEKAADVKALLLKAADSIEVADEGASTGDVAGGDA